MNTIIFSKKDLNDEALKQAASLLLQSKIVAFPTETVYGLGAHIFREEAIKKIYNLKNRPSNKGLIVHLGKIEDVVKVAYDIPDEFYLLAERFFPGPLTVILKKRKEISNVISNNETVAVRIPACIYTTKLINFVGDPIAGTSANISMEKNPICVEDVIKVFNNKVDAIIDGGEAPLKRPSTILDFVNFPYKILREGSISKNQIDEILKNK